MTVSAMSPSVAMPGLVPTAATSLQGQPLAGVSSAMTGGVGSAVVGAQQAQPGIGSRLVSAMKAAITELRGKGASDAQINQQLLAMQAQSQAAATPAAAATATPAAVTAAKAQVKPKKPAKPKTAAEKKVAAAKAKKAQAAKQAAAAKAAKAVTPLAGAAAAGAAVGAVAGQQLPANATQLPNGTVYSYADSANPGLAGLQGLTPQQQLQMGIMPTGMGNALGAYGQRAEGVPQANVTNQSSTGATGVLGMLGTTGLAPTIGAPIMGNTNLSAPAAGTPAAAPTANTTGGTQNVTNRNRSDSSGLNQGADYGMGWGGTGYPYTGGIATPYSPYGASMTGASMVNGQVPQQSSGGILGWFGRLFS